MTPEEQRVKALELAIKASTGYSSHNLALWSDVIVETAGTFEKYIKDGAK